MPRNLGTSRKGKPKKNERAVGMGRALQKAQGQRYRPRTNGKSHNDGGMQMMTGVESIGVTEVKDKTRSVLEVQDLDDFLTQAEMANREFMSEKEGIVVLDSTGQAYKPSTVQWADQKTEFTFCELSVPRRPEWDETTSKEELEANENEAFLKWRRAIAVREEELLRKGSSASSTPFEKNLEVWRQLWRVLERSSCLLQLVDARNPMFYLSSDLRSYAASLGKPMIVLINKSDYLTANQRAAWKEYLTHKGWDPVFFSAAKEQQKLDKAAQEKRREEDGDPRFNEMEDESSDQDSENDQDHIDATSLPQEKSLDGIGVDVPLTREQLMEYMLTFARRNNCKHDPHFENRIQFGMVGFPNVGKSSVINVLVGNSKHTHGLVRVGVAAQPGKTKHFQTLLLPDSDEMMLCDCPGLVFPSFVSNTADLIAAGVYPISQMRDHWPVVNLICQRIPREIINAHYGIHLPVPSEFELHERGLTDLPPPTGEEFLSTLCIARGMLAASSGVPDYTRAARMVIKDYAVGKLLYCHSPPNLQTSDETNFQKETITTALNNTKKLREKLLKQVPEHQVKPKEKDMEVSSKDNDDHSSMLEEFDDDLLDMIGEENPGDGVQEKKKRNMKKHGKKNRKNRNKDPYGCHGSPDDVLVSTIATHGITVNAGKHSQKGYTRPIGYAAGSRSQQMEE